MTWNRADLWLWVALHCDSQSVLEVLGQRGEVSCRRHQGSYRTHGAGGEREGERTGCSLCDQGVGADIKFSDGWKNCHNQQSLFLWDLRMKQQWESRPQEEVSLTVFCKPCWQLNWGSGALEVANWAQNASSPPPSYACDTSRETRCKITAEEQQELQRESSWRLKVQHLWESPHSFLRVSLLENWMGEIIKQKH